MKEKVNLEPAKDSGNFLNEELKKHENIYGFCPDIVDLHFRSKSGRKSF